MHGMTDAPVSEIPSDQLGRYATGIREMIQDQGILENDRASDVQRDHDELVERHNNLRAEVNRRKEEEGFPSNESVSSLGSARNYTFTGNDSQSLKPLEGNDQGSSNNKRKLSSDEEIEEQPISKKIKVEASSGEGSSGQGTSGQGASGQGPSDQGPSNQGPSNVGGNPSRIDYVLDKQSGEMPDIFDADGGD
jgi:hypothetical protein